MKKTIKKSIENFLIQLTAKSEIDIVGLVTIEDIDTDNPFDSLESMIADNNGFDVEIIYYGDAMGYLQENDPSLQYSLGIASDMGFETKNLNSELLASLLASRIKRDKFTNMRNEIESFFEELRYTDDL